MTQLFIRLSDYFRSHRAICWLSMVALFVFFGYFAMQIHLEEDINKLMSMQGTKSTETLSCRKGTTQGNIQVLQLWTRE